MSREVTDSGGVAALFVLDQNMDVPRSDVSLQLLSARRHSACSSSSAIPSANLDVNKCLKPWFFTFFNLLI